MTAPRIFCALFAFGVYEGPLHKDHMQRLHQSLRQHEIIILIMIAKSAGETTFYVGLVSIGARLEAPRQQPVSLTLPCVALLTQPGNSVLLNHLQGNARLKGGPPEDGTINSTNPAIRTGQMN
jgi:hypothetical protein